MKTFSVLTSDLDRNPELHEHIRLRAEGESPWLEYKVTVSPDGKITTFAPVMS